ncbi:hypothetical protein BC828DRAFT_392928 [Blastocladiella britannica]|nr:hypothetical protein BC828DRAFT_392928 [Blastocladiella britannica]
MYNGNNYNSNNTQPLAAPALAISTDFSDLVGWGNNSSGGNDGDDMDVTLPVSPRSRRAPGLARRGGRGVVGGYDQDAMDVDDRSPTSPRSRGPPRTTIAPDDLNVAPLNPMTSASATASLLRRERRVIPADRDSIRASLTSFTSSSSSSSRMSVATVIPPPGEGDDVPSVPALPAQYSTAAGDSASVSTSRTGSIIGGGSGDSPIPLTFASAEAAFLRHGGASTVPSAVLAPPRRGDSLAATGAGTVATAAATMSANPHDMHHALSQQLGVYPAESAASAAMAAASTATATAAAAAAVYAMSAEPHMREASFTPAPPTLHGQQSMASLHSSLHSSSSMSSIRSAASYYDGPTPAGTMALPSLPRVTTPDAERAIEDAVLAINFDDVTVAELKDLLKQRSLPTSGRKAQLVDRIKEVQTAIRAQRAGGGGGGSMSSSSMGASLLPAGVAGLLPLGSILPPPPMSMAPGAMPLPLGWVPGPPMLTRSDSVRSAASMSFGGTGGGSSGGGGGGLAPLAPATATPGLSRSNSVASIHSFSGFYDVPRLARSNSTASTASSVHSHASCAAAPSPQHQQGQQQTPGLYHAASASSLSSTHSSVHSADSAHAAMLAGFAQVMQLSGASSAASSCAPSPAQPQPVQIAGGDMFALPPPPPHPAHGYPDYSAYPGASMPLMTMYQQQQQPQQQQYPQQQVMMPASYFGVPPQP